MLVTTFKGKPVTEAAVISALASFDSAYPDSNDYDHWLDNGNYDYALEYQNRRYPPKRILSEIIGVATPKFKGGKRATNQVFLDLDFVVVSK